MGYEAVHGFQSYSGKLILAHSVTGGVGSWVRSGGTQLQKGGVQEPRIRARQISHWNFQKEALRSRGVGETVDPCKYTRSWPVTRWLWFYDVPRSANKGSSQYKLRKARERVMGRMRVGAAVAGQ